LLRSIKYSVITLQAVKAIDFGSKLLYVPAALSQGKGSSYMLNMKLRRSQSRFGLSGDLFPVKGIELRSLCRRGRCLIVRRNALSFLQLSIILLVNFHFTSLL
jgi:hypothetical protein